MAREGKQRLQIGKYKETDNGYLQLEKNAFGFCPSYKLIMYKGDEFEIVVLSCSEKTAREFCRSWIKYTYDATRVEMYSTTTLKLLYNFRTI